MRTKKVKPPAKRFEYILHIEKENDLIQKKEFYSFKFFTTKEFLTFRYILNIEPDVKDNSINFEILGFRAPVGDLSNFGAAEYEFRLYDFHYHEYLITIHRKDVDAIKFKILLQRSKSAPVKLGRLPKLSFIEIKTE